MTLTASTVVTKEMIDNLEVGDVLPNIFGTPRPITRIFSKGINVRGKAYACFYQQFSEDSTMSNSLHEGDLPQVFNRSI